MDNFDILHQIYENVIKDILANKKQINENIDKTIYHYSSLEGFLGIIEGSNFRGSDSRYLNDPNEIIHGNQLIIKILDELVNDGMYAKWQQDALNTCKELFIHNTSKDKKPIIFITCFSEEGDLLSQWRGYGLNGSGVSIGIPIKNIKKENRKSPYDFIMFHKVVYDDNEKKDIIRREIETVFEFVNKTVNDQITSEITKICSAVLVSLFSLNAVYFKTNSYSEEKEWRAIFEKSEHTDFLFDTILENHFAIKHRISGNNLVSYLEFNLTESNRNENNILPITQIITGPTTNHNLVETQIREYLSFKKYQNVSVIPSNLSYRV